MRLESIEEIPEGHTARKTTQHKTRKERVTMKTWIKALIITFFFGVPAFVLGPVIWPPAAHGPELSSAQLPFAIAVFAIDTKSD